MPALTSLSAAQYVPDVRFIVLLVAACCTASPSCLACRPVSRSRRSWLAAVVRQRVHVVSLATHKLAHSLPPLAEPQPAITGVAFTADSSTLVVAAASHQVAAYGVAGGQPTAWTQQHGGRLPPKLLRMPGIISSIASSPQAPGSLFLASSQACCHLDMAQPLEGSEGEAAGGGGRKRRRSAHKPVPASEPPGGNCRMIYCADPVLHAAYLGPDALLVVSGGGGPPDRSVWWDAQRREGRGAVHRRPLM